MTQKWHFQKPTEEKTRPLPGLQCIALFTGHTKESEERSQLTGSPGGYSHRFRAYKISPKNTSAVGWSSATVIQAQREDITVFLCKSFI